MAARTPSRRKYPSPQTRVIVTGKLRASADASELDGRPMTVTSQYSVPIGRPLVCTSSPRESMMPEVFVEQTEEIDRTVLIGSRFLPADSAARRFRFATLRSTERAPMGLRHRRGAPTCRGPRDGTRPARLPRQQSPAGRAAPIPERSARVSIDDFADDIHLVFVECTLRP